jgi:phage-related protein
MNEKHLRNIFYYKDYYLDFFKTMKPDVQKKLNWTLQLISTVDRIPKKYFEHITNSSGIYEIRVDVGTDIYRVFSFFDKGNLIILINGFQKKTQKTPKNEIELAEKLKKQYFDEKAKK